MPKTFEAQENAGTTQEVFGLSEGAAPESPVLKQVLVRLEQSTGQLRDQAFPFVTLSYAQSLDGSIAALRGYPLELSGFLSASLAHSLRAVHDGILVGIGTVLSDDPRLTVRMARGPDPQPVVLDSRLRFPLNARMLHNGCSRRPWIVTTEKVELGREGALMKEGARVVRVAADRRGWADLRSTLAKLKESGITRLLVEGGARVITNFLRDRLVDQIVITIAPLMVGGLRALDTLPEPDGITYPRLLNICYEMAGQDLVLRGDPSWDS
jgi:3,4-dihydroxy 2-butanone 4-phosphate synthase/GTP cyclohydrolase II